MVHKSGVHQLRLVVYPIVYRVFMDFIHPNGGWPWDFWTINSLWLLRLCPGDPSGAKRGKNLWCFGMVWVEPNLPGYCTISSYIWSTNCNCAFKNIIREDIIFKCMYNRYIQIHTNTCIFPTAFKSVYFFHFVDDVVWWVHDTIAPWCPKLRVALLLGWYHLSLFGGFPKWWYPQSTPKWSNFSRKTHGCWVPPF